MVSESFALNVRSKQTGHASLISLQTHLPE